MNGPVAMDKGIFSYLLSSIKAGNLASKYLIFLFCYSFY